jgi:small subunit ribosomal protein S17
VHNPLHKVSMEEQVSRRKVKKGTVVSNKMNKTLVVKVDRTYRHPEYGKVITRGKKYYAHNEIEGIQVGDQVKIIETRPLSKLKRWRTVAQ